MMTSTSLLFPTQRPPKMTDSLQILNFLNQIRAENGPFFQRLPFCRAMFTPPATADGAVCGPGDTSHVARDPYSKAHVIIVR